jgi:hypothetical protein
MHAKLEERGVLTVYRHPDRGRWMTKRDGITGFGFMAYFDHAVRRDEAFRVVRRMTWLPRVKYGIVCKPSYLR